MYRTLSFLLALLLLCSMVLPIAAADASFTLTLHSGGEPAVLSGASSYTLPTPNAPAGKVFAGWTAQGVFLPAGATFAAAGDTALTALFVEISTQTGANLRVTDGFGLRFLTHISRSDLNALAACTTVGYGTLIAPADYVSAAGGVLTPEALAAAGKTKYLDITAKSFFEETDAVSTVAGSIVQLLSKNYCRDFMGAGYLSVTYTNGTSGRIYAAPANGSCLYTLACAAHCDRTAAADTTHTVATGNGYSPYSGESLAFFAKVMDSVVNVEYLASQRAAVTLMPQNAYYQAPFTAAYDAAEEQLVFTVRQGSAYRFHTDFDSLILEKLVRVKGRGYSSLYRISADGMTLRVNYSDYTQNF